LTPHGRLSGLTCWENFIPLARYYLYSQGVDIWAAPTLAPSDGWIAAMRHIALEGRCYVIGVNPCLRVDQIPADFPHRDRVWASDNDDDGWVEPGNSVIIDPTGKILTELTPHEETILYAGRRPRHGARRSPLLRPSGPLQPTRYLPTPGGHPTPTPSRASRAGGTLREQ
jgi:nitrilase